MTSVHSNVISIYIYIYYNFQYNENTLTDDLIIDQIIVFK